MRVLLIEGDVATAQSIELMLKSEGFNIYTTDLGEDGLDLAKIYDYDIILVDLNLPDMSGAQVLRALRTAKVSTPVMALTAVSDIASKVRFLTDGGDDYMTKPFQRDELVARISAIVRRSKGHSTQFLECGNIRVDLGQKLCHVNGRAVHMTGKIFDLLEALILNKGRVLSKEQLLNQMYGGLDEPESKIIDVFICKLRSAFSRADNNKCHIHTAWGRGYVMREDFFVVDPTATLIRSTTDDERIMGHLADHPGATIQEIIKALNVHGTTIGTNLHRLREKGLARIAGKIGRYTTHRLTDLGVATYEKIQKEIANNETFNAQHSDSQCQGSVHLGTDSEQPDAADPRGRPEAIAAGGAEGGL